MCRFTTILALALAPLAGCGSSEEDSYELVRVSGTITRNGQPLPDAKVSFVPGPFNKVSTPALDQTGPEGDYLLTFRGRSGVAPGKYKVIIQSADLPAGAGLPADYEAQPAMYRMELQAKNRPSSRAGAGKKAGVKNEFDAEVEVDSSGKTLNFDVKAGG